MNHAPQETVAYGNYLHLQGREAEAARIASALLREYPQDVAAHRLAIAAWVGLGEGDRTVYRYRAWMAEAPERIERRLALAEALAVARPGTPESSCSEVERLTRATVAEPEFQFWAARVRLDAMVWGCPGDKATEERSILQVAWAPALGVQTLLRLGDGRNVDAGLSTALAQVWREQPWWLAGGAVLWGEEAGGTALQEARNGALAAARGTVGSPQPALVQAAYAVAHAGGDLPLARALKHRLEALDPGWMEPSSLSALLSQPSYDLEALEALHLRGWTASQRADWWYLRAGLQRQQGMEEESWRSLRRARGLAPGRYTREWLEASLDHPEEHPTALRAVRALLAAPEEGDATLGGWEAWRDARIQERATLYLIAGKLEEELGRPEAAAAAYRMSLLLRPSWEIHLALGTLLAPLGTHHDEALSELLLGMALAPPTAPLAGPRHLAESLWNGARIWDPQGVEGVMEALRPAGLPPSPDDPWKGRTFPDLPALSGGKALNLSSLQGPVVVDVWASWCGPCVEGLPHLEQLALAHPEVTFVALSVDRSAEEMSRYLEGIRPHFLVAWAGPSAMRELGIDSIPHTFVLDDQHRVVTHWEGQDFRRLERALPAP